MAFLGPGDFHQLPTRVDREIPSGFSGVRETIRAMRQLADDGAQDERIIGLARSIVQHLPSRDHEGEARALLSWLQANRRYVRDPFTLKGVERLQHPVVTLFDSHAGDCDDLSMALGALYGAVGIPWGFRTVGSNPTRPNEFRHVYVLAWLDGKGWVPADPMFEEPLGWEPPRADPRAQPFSWRGTEVTSSRDWLP